MSAEHVTQDGLAHQFDDPAQQRSAATLGMWLFLATEVLFFGGLFCVYAVLRSQPRFAEAFAEGSQHLSLPLGTVNTAVLLTSSLTMAMAVHAARLGRKSVPTWLGLTLVLGLTFLGIKAVEWSQDYVLGLIPGVNWHPELGEGSHGEQTSLEMFFLIYFCMTGLHALHMVIGLVVLGCLILAAVRGRYSPRYYTPVEIAGLYWHFVDVVWIFLFPLLYLIRH